MFFLLTNAELSLIDWVERKQAGLQRKGSILYNSSISKVVEEEEEELLSFSTEIRELAGPWHIPEKVKITSQTYINFFKRTIFRLGL